MCSSALEIYLDIGSVLGNKNNNNQKMNETLLKRIKTAIDIDYLKEKQQAAILSCVNKDTLCVLPTGYGKTIIIQALPFLREQPGCVLVINGLNAILSEQTARFCNNCFVVNEKMVNELDGCAPGCGIPSPLSSAKVDIMRLKSDMSVNYIIGHPEHLTKPSVKKLLMSEFLSNRITHIVVDEAHCVLAWGKSQFRPSYMKLGLLRAVLEKANILALTATATDTAQKEIAKALCMREPTIIVESPDRPNVYLKVSKRPPSTGGDHTAETAYHAVLDPILQKLKNDGHRFEKTIVYVPLKECGLLHHHAVTEFLDDHPDHKSQCDATTDCGKLSTLVSQYHAPQSQNMKSLIGKSMNDPCGSLRLLFATEAYSMGVDVSDIRHIVHIGPPNNLETFVQEIGRCGRDGEPARATLHYNNSDIASNLPHLHDKMREYCMTKICRRQFINNYFGIKTDVKTDSQTCCDNCSSVIESQIAKSI